MTPDDRRYSRDHEWVLLDGDIATVGITHFAAESLGDVVFVDLPDSGASVGQFEKFGEIESVKAVSDLLSPLSGTVVECNGTAIDNPETVNQAPYAGGWLVKIRLSDMSELDALLDADGYDQHIADSA